MNRHSQEDEDQDSLFGSPPPSPARGRSPSEETSVRGEELCPAAAVSSAGARITKNVGTIALPGSHMSCAELPANLPASSLSLPLPGSSQDFLSIPRPSLTGTPLTLQPRAGSAPSRPSSTASSTPSASTRKRKPPRARSTASAPPPPPITLPGPNEPTPPNFLRSQSALLGHAGLVGSVKPAKLHTHERPSVHPSCSETPTRGSTPTHPIVLDDDQDNSQVRKRPSGQIQLPQRVDQLDPEALRANILNSLAKEKNTLPVLESLIKLLGGEPQRPPPSHPPPQPFARPYGHGIFDIQSTPPGSSPSTPPTPPVAPPVKRRKLKHVPAGAADWDVPFPFAPGEGPEVYHDTWARDRAKQLVTQLLELVQGATKRAAIKTSKNTVQKGRGRTPQAQTSAPKHHLSLETQGEQNGSTEAAPTAFAGPTSQSLGLESSTSSRSSSLPASSRHASQVPHTIQDEAIDPTLLAISCPTTSTSQTHAIISSTSTLASASIDTQMPIADIASPPPALAHSPRTSLSSFTEPLTPLSDAFTEVPTTTNIMMAHQEHAHDPLSVVSKTHQTTEKDQQVVSESLLAQTEPSQGELFRLTAAQKGKGRADAGLSLATPAPSVSSRSAPGTASTIKGNLDKQAIVARAKERRKELVAEIERSKIELWKTSIEAGVLVHLTRDEALARDAV